VDEWIPTRAEMEAVAACTTTDDPVCAAVIEKLRIGCAEEGVECRLPALPP
jgi:hypothetical protein